MSLLKIRAKNNRKRETIWDFFNKRKNDKFEKELQLNKKTKNEKKIVFCRNEPTISQGTTHHRLKSQQY